MAEVWPVLLSTSKAILGNSTAEGAPLHVEQPSSVCFIFNMLGFYAVMVFKAGFTWHNNSKSVGSPDHVCSYSH